MSIFRNKIVFKLIASLCVFLALLNFGLTNRAFADDNEIWGGILITPVTKLLTFLADGIMGLLHKAIQNQDLSIITISGASNWWEQWGKKAITTILVVALVGIAVVWIAGAALTAGTILATIKAVAGGVATVIGVEVLSLTFTGKGAATYASTLIVEKFGNWFGDNLYMPAFTLTPEEIFADKIWLFDVNFFKSDKEYKQLAHNPLKELMDNPYYTFRRYWYSSGI